MVSEPKRTCIKAWLLRTHTVWNFSGAKLAGNDVLKLTEMFSLFIKICVSCLHSQEHTNGTFSMHNYFNLKPSLHFERMCMCPYAKNL